MSVNSSMRLRDSAEPFLEFLDDWFAHLPIVSMKSLLKKFTAERTAIICVDVVNGFCKQGNLASPRVGAIVDPIVKLFKLAEQHGITHYVLPQDNHPENSKEFEIYPRHCLEGSIESQTVEELKQLPNSNQFKIIPKNTINPGLEGAFQNWVEQNPQISNFIVVGDCTDLCVYQLAMYLKLQAIKNDKDSDVIVPANCVDTFDINMETYRSANIPPHPGDFLHAVFMYHLHLNGIHVVSQIE